MGEFHREIATEDPLSQRLFDQGMVLHFGFNHAEAARSFREGARLDPECAMCFAGLALSLGPNYNAAMAPGNAEPAYEAAQRALALREGASAPNRAMIEAIARRYPGPTLKQRDRGDADYADAIARVSQRFPQDADLASLHAEALMVLHPWDLWTHAREPRPWTHEILTVLEQGLDDDPRHPFLNHLYIHAQEPGPRPEAALPSAERLETLVPGAGHLVHMPSHVYIRTGRLHEASLANERAIEVDEAYLEQVEAQGAYPLAYVPHNHHFLWATTTLEGRSERALEAARQVAEKVDREMMRQPGFGTLQHYLSIPYYAQVAFGRHEEILAMPAPEEDLLYPRAVHHYARGMAFAARGEITRAERELAAVKEASMDARLEEVTIWDINSTRELMRIAAKMLAGEIALARDQMGDAVALLREAVALEDALNYDEPPPWGPATRRYLGAALLEAGRPTEAERVYREDLAAFPENGWSLFGLAESLREQGEEEAAAQVAARFERAWRHADVSLTASRL